MRYPCPTSASLLIVTSPQRLQFDCGVDLVGGDLSSQPATSLLQCKDFCLANSSCLGVTYEAAGLHGTGPRNCYLKSSIQPEVSQSFVVDSAILIPNDVVEDCSQLGSSTNVGGTQFKTYCGQDYPHNDAAGVHAKSMKDCLSVCANNRGTCAGVSYEAAMTQGHGYWNCYLKSATAFNGLVIQPFVVDSAFVIDPSNPVASMSSLPAPSFAASIATLASLPPAISYASVATLSASSTLSTLGGAATSTGVSSSIRNDGNSLSKGAIAGIAIGALAGVAFLAVIVGILYRRRRRSRAANPTNFQGVNPNIAYTQPGHADYYQPPPTYHHPAAKQVASSHPVAPVTAELPSPTGPGGRVELAAPGYGRVQ